MQTAGSRIKCRNSCGRERRRERGRERDTHTQRETDPSLVCCVQTKRGKTSVQQWMEELHMAGGCFVVV